MGAGGGRGWVLVGGRRATWSRALSVRYASGTAAANVRYEASLSPTAELTGAGVSQFVGSGRRVPARLIYSTVVPVGV